MVFSRAPVQAQGLTTPEVRPGQFVYTVPNDFDPPYIGPDGIGEIQSEAKRLHFPYYVVIAKEYGGSSTEALSDALDKLVDDWAKKPKFDRATTSVAILTYSPRKFRILAASKWRAKLGLEGQEGSQRFVDIFSSYVQGSSKDPKTGIIESMKALDQFVFENTDPKRLAAKAEAERKAGLERAETEKRERAQRVLNDATESLDTQIDRGDHLLEQTEVLPPDTNVLRSVLIKAKATRVTRKIDLMFIATEDLRQAIDPVQRFASAKLATYVAEVAAREHARRVAMETQQRETRRQQLQRTELFAIIIGSLALLGTLLFWQWRRFFDASSKFKQKTGAWEEALLNAANNHTRFFEERQKVTELASTTGNTKAKYDEVTREVGAIYPTIEAMRDRVNECKRIFSQGSFLRIGPLRQALALLEADFEFDTETMNRKSLFESPVRIIKIKPAELQSQLDQQYAENITDWDELMQALNLRETIAQDAFGSQKLTALLKLATQKQIPHRWLATHPLFGDDEADRHFYGDLNALRLTDPLAYKQRIDGANGLQNELGSNLDRLIAAHALVDSKRVKTLPTYAETVAAPDDDPTLTLSAAIRADESVVGFLTTEESVTEVEHQAKTAADLYSKALEQTAVLQSAMSGVEGDINALSSRVEQLRQLQLDARSRVQNAGTIHADVAAPNAVLDSGNKYLSAADTCLHEARGLVAQRRHLDAQRQAQNGTGNADAAERDLHQSIQLCNQLDEQKRDYDRQVAQLAAARTEAEASIRRYGRQSRFDDFNSVLSNGPVNYGLMMSQVNSYRQQLDDEVRRARRSYEEEQARIAREQEAQRQRERAEERRRSSSSSSSSSWSGGSSSSSGTSWSGGSSSSSGTDW